MRIFYFIIAQMLAGEGLSANVQFTSKNDSGVLGRFLPGGVEKWEWVWREEFDGTEADFDDRWESQNGPSGHILCSRWRENVSVEGGVLTLANRKERRGGQEWTSGSVWTKERFQYGYFECRYRYAAAEATNNSFWLMTKGPEPQTGKRFEIDINEGHFPNRVNTNIHNWTDVTVVDGKKIHPSDSRSLSYGVNPAYTVDLEIPVRTKKLRFSSKNSREVRIGEFQIFGATNGKPPSILTGEKGSADLINFASEPGTKTSVSGFLAETQEGAIARLVDGKVKSAWVSQKEGEKWIEFEFAEEKTVGCIQFTNGWFGKGDWHALISDYKIEYFDGAGWIGMRSFDVSKGEYDFARDFHTFGLDWNEEELVFYLDGKEIRRETNEFCHSPSPVWLSLAIIKWAGPITPALDGSRMEVDYVRVFRRKTRE